MFTHHQAMIYKRDVIGNLRYEPDYKIAGDYAFTRAFLKNCRNISYIPAAICIFETGGVSQKNQRLGRIEQYKARQQAGCKLPMNVIVFTGQSVTAALKRYMPQTYHKLKA